MIKKENLKDSKKIYQTGIIRDFPIAERIPYSRFKRAIKNKLMNAYSFYIDNKRYGYIVTQEDNDVIFISYLAIDKQYRNKGYGSQMIKEIVEFFKNKKYIIIEADSEEGIKNEKALEIIKRRKNFYYKNGFEEIPNINYKLFGVRYDLLVYKINLNEITNVDATLQMKSFYKKIARSLRFFTIDIK